MTRESPKPSPRAGAPSPGTDDVAIAKARELHELVHRICGHARRIHQELDRPDVDVRTRHAATRFVAETRRLFEILKRNAD